MKTQEDYPAMKNDGKERQEELNLKLGNLNDTSTVNAVTGKANHGKHRVIQSKRARIMFMHLCYIEAFDLIIYY